MQKALVFIVSLLSILNLTAGETEYNIRKNRSELNVSADSIVMTVNYPIYSGYGTPDELRHQGKVRLEYDRENQSDITWDYNWRYTVIFQYQESGTQTCTLSISYDEGAYVYSDYKLFLADTSLDSREITIINIIGEYEGGAGWETVTNAHSDVHLPTDIHLELAIITQRYYELDEEKEIPLLFNVAEQEARWHFFQGAESYDLEWVFIDSASLEYAAIMGHIASAIDSTDFGDSYSEALPFTLKEPTRVNIKGSYYHLDMTYPSGLLFLRVRPVGVYTGADNPGDDFETVKTGMWSYYSVSDYTSGNKNQQSLAWHEIDFEASFASDQNWLYGISFAEDGKSVSTVSYFDGSLRGRQSLVYNTSDDITLVGESKFDYEGRQTVSVIPAPVEGRDFVYQENFNQNTSNLPFDKNDFDKTIPEALDIDPTGGTKGSAQYFSTNNTFTNDQYRGAIPIADGYVYSQVKFNKDATGRVSEVAGIGETFAMGNGHTTKYFYGTANDFELRRLFGDEVGYADNYKKTYVVDPNGQASMTYSDNHGRVIATSLAGDAPANLIALDDSDAETVTVPISVDNAVSTAYEKKSRVTFVNLSASSDYTFNYNFNGVIYGVENPNDSTEVLCAKCSYTLYFHIEDPDGDTITASIDTVYFNADGADVCSGTGMTSYVPDSANIDLGTYTLNDTGEYTAIKRLVVNYEALLDSVNAEALIMLGDFQNFADSILADVDLSGCFNDCDSYCAYKMEKKVNLTGSWAAFTQTQKDSAIAACVLTDCSLDELWNGDEEDNYLDSLYGDETIGAMNECEGIKQQMIEQIIPGGLVWQNLGDPASEGSLFWSWDNLEEELGIMAGQVALYDSYDEDCVPTVGASYITSSVNLQAAVFQPCWIEKLLPFHREYCHYETCVALAETKNADSINSKVFDFMMASYGAWPGDPDIADYIDVTLDIDPLNNSDIETVVEAYTDLFWLEMITAMSDTVCGGTGAMDLDEYIDSLWICVNGSGTLSAQDSIDKWTMFVGKYMEKKNQYINFYKDTVNLMNEDWTLGQFRGCLYYDDEDAIVVDPLAYEDSLADEDAFNNAVSYIESQVGTVLSFNCADQCNINVANWMQNFPDTCQQILDDNSYELYDSLEMFFQAYCNTSCQNGNVFGWFYDNETPEFDTIVWFFDYHSELECGLESIQIDTAYLDFDTVVTVNILSQCLTDLVAVVNANLPGTGSSVAISGADSLYGCLEDTDPVNIQVTGTLDSLNLVISYLTDCVDRAILAFYDLAGDSINLSLADSIKNVSASQLYDSLAYADVYFGDSVVTAKILIGDCFVSQPQYILNYTPPQIPNPVVDCIDEAYASALFEAEQIYYGMLNDLVNNLLDSIDCMSGIVENYTMEYEIKEYQYTLYYYDQAGNLTTTVPPLGVHPLSQATFNAAYNYNTHAWTAGNNPDHDLQTLYTYNGANELTKQETFDGGITNYYYDNLFRLRFSQNAQQLIDNKISYTIYDELGRPTEAGEAGDTDIDPLNFLAELNDYTYPENNLKRDFVKTYYEEGYTGAGISAVFITGQQNLRNRIAAVEQRMAQYEDTDLNTHVKVTWGTDVYLITSYSYDFHGNVKEVVQTNSHLVAHQHQHKLIEYNYDLISGNVKEVYYQKDEVDEWDHRYQYDAGNKLVRAWTSDDHEEWEMDAKYFYYLHGNLARVETGHDKVQGTDYAYNLQGWLKGVNSTTLQTSRDLGGDAKTTDLDKYSGTDVYGFSLGYFEDDYTPISAAAFANTDALISANGAKGNLYNGNITHMVTAMKDDNETMLDVLGNIYKYDQLQRIKSMDVYSVATQATYISNNSFTGATVYNSGAYAESYSFDKNGNLDSLTRNDDTGASMDDFTYLYDATKKNRLLSVDDAAGSGVSAVDVDDQAVNNYGYNAIGQLISDTQENITNIEWTVTGKVRKVYQSDGDETEFIYDAMGNRVMKIERGINQVGAVYTYYVLDASGNVMTTYEREITLNGIGAPDDYNDALSLQERMIYGSKRIGVKNENRLITDFDFTPSNYASGFYWNETYTWGEQEGNTSDTNFYDSNFEKEKKKVGEKYFEFSNHLGNVLEVTTDRKIRNTGETAYEADGVSYQDFGPYGQSLTGRSGSTDVYKFSFQGQESDPEIKGEDNSINYKYRMHDPRIGRFFAVDPLIAKYAHYTPYSFSGNKVIAFVELEGMEEYFAADGTYLGKVGNGSTIYVISNDDVNNFVMWAIPNLEENSDQAGIYSNATIFSSSSASSQTNITYTIWKNHMYPQPQYVELPDLISVTINNIQQAQMTMELGKYNLTVNMRYLYDGKLLVNNYYNYINLLDHERRHGAGIPGDGWNHFNIALWGMEHWSWEFTTDEYKAFTKDIMFEYLNIDMEGHLAEMLHSQNTEESFMTTLNSDYFQNLYNKYLENVKKYEEIWGEDYEEWDLEKYKAERMENFNKK